MLPKSKKTKKIWTTLAALVVGAGMIGLAPNPAQAQNTNSGTVAGQVTDAQGAAIVGAVIVLTNTATNGAQPTVTNKEGRYIFTNLQPGTYAIDVKKDGFKEAVVKNETVALGKPLTINVPMQVGSATQTVEVTASGAELQTLNATVGTTVGSDAIMKLPAMGRDANTLTMLQPNTQPDGGVGGASLDENTYSLDGGSNSDDMDGAHSIYTPSSGNTGTSAGGNPSGVIPTPTESIQTFTVGVSNQSADVNSAAGSSVTMATKRGTDAIHGSVYEYYLGSKLGANSWSNNATDKPRAVSHQNRFGASLGGVILPKWLGGKTYLFGDYEGRRYPNYAVYNHNTPTDSLRHGVVAYQQADGSWDYVNLTPTSQTIQERQVNSSGVASYVSTQVAPGSCQGGAPGNACDPQGLGLNPVTDAIWSNYMPMWNNPVQTPGGDGGYNTGTFTSSLNESLKSNFFVTRLDHDFGAKNHFTSTYHFYSFNPNYPAQVDIGGALPGDTFGQAATPSQRPELPSMFTAQLTSSLTPNTTNAFNYSYLRNFWQWTGVDTAPQALPGSVTLPGSSTPIALSALAGTMEISGETSNGLQPYNVNAQSTRTRFWDGIGQTFSDNVSVIHGNHVFQFGGKYTHQRDMHQRNDNGGAIDTTTAYLTNGSNITNPYLPTGFTGTKSTYNTYYNEVLGIVSQSQTMYTRAGQNLTLQAQGTPLEDESEIPLYNVYFSDAWHIKPSLTLNYGAGYTVEMPPYELNGRQVEAVDGNGLQVSAASYLAQTERDALGGQVYNPTLGFATVGNVAGGVKYPYNTFYGGLSPRLSIAWNPNISGGWLGDLMGGNKTVIRGGWSRIYGRLNGVDQVLVPLLGTGLAQPIACQAPLPNGTCAGVGNATAANAFRIGPTANGDSGMSVGLGAPPTTNLPQPYYPGEIQNGVINPNAGSNDSLDPSFKPDRSDEFDLTIQRQFSPTFSTEFGYTGRVIRNEYTAVNLDAVPYMLTSGGQQFQQGFAQMALQMMAGDPIAAQPFFETALGGPNSAFCTGYASCTAAVAAKYGPSGKDTLDPTTGFDVFNLWSALQSSPSWQLGRTTPDAPTTCSTPNVGGCPSTGVVASTGQLGALFQEASLGWGNYNSLFWTVSMRNFHGLTAISNFTWSKSMGLGDLYQASSEYTISDPFNLHAAYGPSYDDTPLNYNLYFIYEPGSKTQHGLMGHLLHGWSLAPVLTWNDVGSSGGLNFVNGLGNSNTVDGGDFDSFGEVNGNFGYALESAVKTTGYTGGSTVSYNSNNSGKIGSSSNPGQGGTGINQFGSNAAAVYGEFRPIILGYDTTATSGFVPALGDWNVDFSVTKDLALSERFSTELNAQATNVFNHFAPATPGLYLNDPASFGAVTGNALAARAVEVGLAVRW